MRARPYRLLALLTLAALAAGTLGCVARRGPVITVHGSDTMVLLGQQWAERYMSGHAGIIVQVNGGGSGTGIAALINGSTDICQASRPMKPKEREQMQAKYGSEPEEIVVARDGVTVYLHVSNPLPSLTVDQLRRIYRGEITNWKEVGGSDGRIVVYGRENSSGTYAFFKEHVLGESDFAPGVQTLSGTGAVVNAVAQDPAGIGYGGAAYAAGIRICPLSAEPGSEAVHPDLESVLSGAYPLARDLYFYLRGQPEGATADFVNWVLGEEGQAIVSSVGYFPLSGGVPTET